MLNLCKFLTKNKRNINKTNFLVKHGKSFAFFNCIRYNNFDLKER